MAELVLIHGAWHGAWCWNELIPELQARGHAAHAIDLPGLGDDHTPDSEVSLKAYADRVASYVGTLNRPVWLVGHSMGGLPITQAAEWIPDRVEGLVYVTASLLLNGQSMADLFAQGVGAGVSGHMRFDPKTNTAWVPDEYLKEMFYNCCTDAQVERAKRLLRPRQPMAPTGAAMAITLENFGSIPRYYIECLQDHALLIDMQRRMQAASGVDGVATLDTDHSPFFSCPAALAGAISGFVALAG